MFTKVFTVQSLQKQGLFLYAFVFHVELSIHLFCETISNYVPVFGANTILPLQHRFIK